MSWFQRLTRLSRGFSLRSQTVAGCTSSRRGLSSQTVAGCTSSRRSNGGIPPPHDRVNVWDVIVWTGPLVIGGFFLSEIRCARLREQLAREHAAALAQKDEYLRNMRYELEWMEIQQKALALNEEAECPLGPLPRSDKESPP